MSDGITRAMTRKVRAAFEFYMVTQEGMSAGDAIRECLIGNPHPTRKENSRDRM